jgi:putative SOS response-associated peptidase YedK
METSFIFGSRQRRGHRNILFITAEQLFVTKLHSAKKTSLKSRYGSTVFIVRRQRPPLFFAGLSDWRPGADKDAAHGFAIITNDAAGGMIDVHDRRPVALPPDLAIHWMDIEFPMAQAIELVKHGLPVRQEGGNSKYQLPDAIEPVAV